MKPTSQVAPARTGPAGELRARHFWWIVVGATLLLGAVYVGLRWSPSSYAVVLDALGVEDRGLVVGQPRAVRGDEFGWQTPLLQMAVRNNFDRIDRTPPYHEDLRTLYALPLSDWALLFKPQLWLFRVAQPDFAFSFYQAFLIALFGLGAAALLFRLGVGKWESLLGAGILFFSAYTQYWWNGAANFFFAFFPAIVASLLLPIRFWQRLVLFYYLLTCGLLSYFYPPNAIALAFAGAILVVAAGADLLTWRRLTGIAAAAAAAGGTAVFYLRDALRSLAGTVYPGHRINGGGGLGFPRWVSQFLPTSQIHHHESLIGGNVCEIATLGSIYLLAVLFLLDWRALPELSAEVRRRLAIIAGGLVLTQAWMVIALPPWVGYPLLWQLVPPGRMVVAGGFLLLVLGFLLSQAVPLRLGLLGVGLVAVAVLASWLGFKQLRSGIGFLISWKDTAILWPLAVIYLVDARWGLGRAGRHRALLAAALVVGVVSFGSFNPIQSTRPIFARHDTPVTRELDRRLREEKQGFLLIRFGESFFGHTGLPLVGLGYPSLSYETFAPRLDLWRRFFPDLPEAEFQRLFDNAGAFGFADLDQPQRLPGTLLTLIPAAPFLRPGLTVADLEGQPGQRGTR